MERVGHGRLTAGEIGVPQRPLAGPQRPSQPQVASPEELAQVADEKHAIAAEAGKERHQSDGGDDRRPEARRQTPAATPHHGHRDSPGGRLAHLRSYFFM